MHYYNKETIFIQVFKNSDAHNVLENVDRKKFIKHIIDM